MKKYLFSLLLLLMPLMMWAQDQFTVSAPTIVALGQPFRVEFVATEEIEDFSAPSFDGFNVIAGPTVSTSTNIEYINGVLNRSNRYTYTYVLVPEVEGNAKIGAATGVIDGKSQSTKTLDIEVTKERGSSQQSSSQNRSGSGSNESGTILPDDILLRAVANRKSVYVGEPLLVELKVYSRVQIAGINNARLAAFNGFWNQEVAMGEPKMERETYNGKVYDTWVIKNFLLFPQKSGELQIEQMSLDAIASVVVDNGAQSSQGSLFDSFFGMRQQVMNVTKQIKTTPIKIDVKPLPTGAPESFTGAVGEFKISSKINSEKISANGSNAIVLNIEGSGNFPLIANPKLDLPGSFEVYPSKTKDNYKTTISNINGSKSIEYPFIARAEGEFTLPAIEFTYFSPKSSKYITLSSDTFPLKVLADMTGSTTNSGIVSSVSKEDLRILGEDIHFIKVGDHKLRPSGDYFVGSVGYIIILLLICAIFAATIIYLNKRIKELRDTVKQKNKKANKVALSRLKNANKHMKDNMQNEFYSEMLRALSGYVSDKLNIEVARLSKETIREAMEQKSVVTEDIEQLLSTISDCEFAQYSPSTDVKMSDVYERTLLLIGRLESKL
ncbi:MAG: BatD family protein [Rikenellaceae bacterium]